MMTIATRACIVREAILDGYGVEDIVVMFGIPEKAVRFEIQMLRENGTLKKPKWKTLGDLARNVRGSR